MQRKLLFFVLSIEAVACLLLVTLRVAMTGAFTTIMAFPFEQIGLTLRMLSLSGTTGNIVAIALYMLLCLVPCFILLIRKKRGLHLEDGLLGLLSASLFAALYLMINPGLIASILNSGNPGLPVMKSILGGTVYSILCAYIILRVLRLFFTNGIEKLQSYMSVLLCLLNILFVYLIFGAGVTSLLDSFTTLQSGNVGNEHLLGVSYVFLVLQFIVDSLPFALNILVVFAGLTLLHEMMTNRYSEASVIAAEKLSRFCGIVLSITVLTTVAFNILQLLFAKALLILNNSIQIPLFSIVFVLATLLLSRFVAENKALKDDNNSII